MTESERIELELENLKDKLARTEEALQHIAQWADAYPLEIFPEPDLVLARQLLAVGGITLDAVSASAMRHVIEQVGKIAKEGLGL